MSYNVYFHYITIEEFIPGNFVNYLNNTGIMCTTQYDVEYSQQKLTVTDIQGSGYLMQIKRSCFMLAACPTKP